MSTTLHSHFCALLLALGLSLTVNSTARGNATINIQNNDLANVGFNDPTPAAPVGGNNGTTVGQQRLNAFMFAAGIWGATLNSVPNITISASWPSLPCDTGSAVLAQSGSVGMRRDFPNAPFASTWYGTALANAISGTDQNGAGAEISAEVNVGIGTTGCLQNSFWYYGLDGNHGNGIDLVAVLLHEFAHGLGFQTFTSGSTGLQSGGLPTIYDRFLRDDSTGKLWVNMTNAERAASAINTGNLVWAGPQVTTDAPSVLGGTPRLRVNSPLALAGNFNIGLAQFGPSLTSAGITANVVGASPADGCTAIGGSVSGKIAFIDRGNCNFTVKVKNAQNAGALAVIIGNVASSINPDIAPGMGGTDATITIPSVSLNLTDANSFRAQLGNSINASILLDLTALAGADSANRLLMFSPNPFQGGSSVSHYDSSAFPDQLMEPNNSSDLTHSVMVPQDLTFSLLRDIGWTGASAPPPPSIQLASATGGASENIGSLSVSVTRTGDTSGTSTVDYATSDNAGTNPCSQTTGAASSRCDYLQTLGKLIFAPGETSKTILIPIINDTFVEGPETFTLTLSNVTGATLGTSSETLTINDDGAEGGANPIDSDATFFVRQQYVDFLNREPDPAGLAFWVGNITGCGANAQCAAVARINVSAAFFLSIEFQNTGYLVYRFYKTAFGNLQGGAAPVPIGLSDFLRDTQRIGQGVQVNVGDWQNQLEANKVAYALDFVRRGDFLTAYPTSMTPTTFVTQLNTNAGNVLSLDEQTTLINLFGGAATTSDETKRAQVLRSVAEDNDLKNAEFNKAFVLMQYFGYLRRNPNDFPEPGLNFSGFNFWLDKLVTFNGDFIQAEMVKAFLQSDEYRHRFAP